MRTSFALLAAGAAFAAAQSLSSLPQCGQTCIQNMIVIASTTLGCTAGNVTCYCSQPAFGYGIRDCANQACPNQQDAQTVISYGTQYCANVLVGTSVGGSLSATQALTNTAASASTYFSTTAGSGTTGSSVTLSSTVINTAGPGNATLLQTTSYLTSVYTSGGSTYTTTTGSTTILGPNSNSASVSSLLASGNSSSAVTSTITSGGSTITTTSTHGPRVTLTGGSGNNNNNNNNNGGGSNSNNNNNNNNGNNAGASSTTSSGYANAMRTAAPGLLGAAALAVFAL